MTPQRLFLVWFILFPTILHAAHADPEGKNEPKQEKIGNFSLPASQQPGPLLGFGQNVVDKRDLLASVYGASLCGHHKNITEIVPSILYGIRDDLSLFIEFPIAAHFKEESYRSSGLEDIITQVEYAPYIHETKKSVDMLSFIGSFYLPSGNDRKAFPTGFGSPSFFVGATLSRLATEWYCYTSYCALLTTRHTNRTKAGSQFWYQAGFGKNIAYKPDAWLLTWMIECSGMYAQKSKVDGSIDQDTGGNTLLLGPVVWFSTDRLFVQAGVTPVIAEHLFGKQQKSHVFISFNISWKFN